MLRWGRCSPGAPPLTSCWLTGWPEHELPLLKSDRVVRTGERPGDQSLFSFMCDVKQVKEGLSQHAGQTQTYIYHNDMLCFSKGVFIEAAPPLHECYWFFIEPVWYMYVSMTCCSVFQLLTQSLWTDELTIASHKKKTKKTLPHITDVLFLVQCNIINQANAC